MIGVAAFTNGRGRVGSPWPSGAIAVENVGKASILPAASTAVGGGLLEIQREGGEERSSREEREGVLLQGERREGEGER